MTGNQSKPGAPLAPAKNEPGPYAWYVVFMGLLVSMIAVMDRQILGLLVDPIKADLVITDVQFSLLTGLAFSLFYAICGLPMGAVVDKKSRVAVLTSGIVVWSLATIASCLSRTYTFLFVCRMIVGVGESVLQPATKSIITDLFHGKHLGKAIALVALGSAIGGGLSLILGGAILRAVDPSGIVLPLLGELKPWQFVFFCFGVPGILLAIVLVLTVKDPPRRGVLVNVQGTAVSGTYGDLFRFCREHPRTMGCLVFGYAIFSLGFQGLMAWTPSVLTRQFGMERSDVGSFLGTATLIINVGLMLISGWWVDRKTAKGAKDAALRWSIVSGFVGVLPLLIFPHVSSSQTALVLLILGMAGATGQIIGAIPLMQLMPSQLRGKAMVSYLLIANLFSGVLGPYLVANLTDNVFKDPAMVGYSLSIVAGGALVIAASVLWAGLKAYRESIAALAERTV